MIETLLGLAVLAAWAGFLRALKRSRSFKILDMRRGLVMVDGVELRDHEWLRRIHRFAVEIPLITFEMEGVGRAARQAARHYDEFSLAFRRVESVIKTQRRGVSTTWLLRGRRVGLVYRAGGDRENRIEGEGCLP